MKYLGSSSSSSEKSSYRRRSSLPSLLSSSSSFSEPLSLPIRPRSSSSSADSRVAEKETTEMPTVRRALSPLSAAALGSLNSEEPPKARGINGAVTVHPRRASLRPSPPPPPPP
eukprot:CAMPEP_0171840364 /NCGR_PEP_ID=MMETSP0992-20121227/13922_1 /TAXON_ID=483369 /ORGANISM="non described non described, Strain CCMP2098" /LENGTH=113 /DNA_ID=CAMNT_0012457139 /DNA_START=177 /DNA_END=514 /DNA_ORIENTATION=-